MPYVWENRSKDPFKENFPKPVTVENILFFASTFLTGQTKNDLHDVLDIIGVQDVLYDVKAKHWKIAIKDKKLFSIFLEGMGGEYETKT